MRTVSWISRSVAAYETWAAISSSPGGSMNRDGAGSSVPGGRIALVSGCALLPVRLLLHERSRGEAPWSRELRIRAVIAVVVILLIRLGAFRGHGLNADPWRAGIGLVLFALGLAFAIWARIHIGRNWGMPMTQEGQHGAGDQRSLPSRSPPDLLGHPRGRRRHRGGTGLVVADCRGPGWGLLPLQRDGRGALHEPTSFQTSYPVYKRSTKLLVPFIL